MGETGAIGAVRERWDSMVWARPVESLDRHPQQASSAVGSTMQ